MVANPFPYCSRIGRSPIKKTSIKAKPLNPAISSLECKCRLKQSKSDLMPSKSEIIFSLPEICEIKMHIPYLVKMYFYPQNVTCFRNLLLINFEGALGYFTSVLYIKSGAFKALRQISRIFQLILIISMETNGKDEIIQTFIKKDVKLAGVYTSISPPNASRETNKLQNYSQIYADFDCDNPHESTMIISTHKFTEEVMDIKDFIYLHRGLGPKLNVNRVPIATLQYPEPPCTVLIPDYNFCTKITFIAKLLEDLQEYLQSYKAFRDTFNFVNFFQCFEYQTATSAKPYHIMLNSLLENIYNCNSNSATRYQKSLIGHCRIHNRYYINYPKQCPKNLFILDHEI